MTYLTRPVFGFVVNWVDLPSIVNQYALNETALGFGGASISPLQSHTSRQIELTVELATRAEIDEWEAFCDALSGRLQGFWIAHPLNAFDIANGVSTTQLDATDADLADTLADHPAQYFIFDLPDGTRVAAKCSSASVLSATQERLTFDASLGATPATSWSAHRLLYVRFASDDEKATVINEGHEVRKVRVIELPTEYAAFETGTLPVFLYRFYVENPDGTQSSWRYTNGPADIVSNSETFTAKNLKHGSLRRSMRAENEELSVDAMWESSAPWANYLPFPASLPLWLELSSCEYATPDTTTLEFTGRLGPSPEFDGRNVSMRFASWMDSMESPLPRPLIGPRCPYKLGDSATCKKSLASFTYTGTLGGQVGTRVLVEDASLASVTNQWFAFGWLIAGTAPNKQVRAILASTSATPNTVTLQLNARLKDVADGETVTIIAGCDKTPESCDVKFSNYPNFGGFPYVPRTNLTLKAVEIDPSAGGKK